MAGVSDWVRPVTLRRVSAPVSVSVGGKGTRFCTGGGGLTE
jgi:hypothetical protein